MSEFHVEVVRIGKVGKHPNADNLELTTVRGSYTAIIKTGQFKEGDLAVWVPEDSIVPENGDPRWTPLNGQKRIKARRLRRIFSMGLLVEADPSWAPGQNVQNELGITKWEPEIPLAGGQNEKGPGVTPVFTDLESYRRYPDIIQEGQNVVILEKIHGCNSRFVYHEDRLYCGSHHHFKADQPKSLWWIAARKYDLENKLKTIPDISIYGEIYGQVQKGFQYGVPQGEYALALFDAMNTKSFKYFDYDDFVHLTKQLDLPVAPLLYRGPWSKELTFLQNGPSMVPGANNIREGFVVKPDKELWDEKLGRVVLKLVGEDFLLKKHK